MPGARIRRDACRELLKFRGRKRELTIRRVQVQVVRDANVSGRGRQNIRQPASVKKVVRSSILQSCIFVGYRIQPASGSGQDHNDRGYEVAHLTSNVRDQRRRAVGALLAEQHLWELLAVLASGVTTSAERCIALLGFMGNKLMAHRNTFIANERVRARNDLLHVKICLAAE